MATTKRVQKQQKTKRRAAPKKPGAARTTKAQARTPARAKVSRKPGAAAPKAATPQTEAPASPAPAPPPPKKPTYYEAIAIYESGVRALQRHDFSGAADQFRTVISRYPEERELHERSLLYLRVCERETARRPPVPQTPPERVYAATVALNAGDHTTAMDHLRRALEDAPDSDHAHYIMSVALVSRGQSDQALDHLRRAISLNPDNRNLARQDPDLESVRDANGFRDLLDVTSEPPRPRKRR
jgi:TolA-binding protein